MISKGIKFSKRANTWVTYLNINVKDKVNQIFWFDSRKEAEDKLKELNGH